MKKRDVFFISLFSMFFLLSAMIMAGDYLDRAMGQQISTEQTEPEVLDESIEQTEPFVQQETESASEEEAGEETKIQEAEKQPLEFQTVGYEYFDDALFIGDSRTVGIMEYGGLEHATFFADSGMSVFGVQKKKISVPGIGKVTLDEVLRERQYGKIYLMLGMNELGYRFDAATRKYQETVEVIRAQQEDAIIYLCANMHVTAEQSEKDDIYNNENVNRRNEEIAALADGEQIFYLDVNERFDDESGSLATEYSSDAFHVLGKYYVDWVDWLCTKGIVLPVSQQEENS